MKKLALFLALIMMSVMMAGCIPAAVATEEAPADTTAVADAATSATGETEEAAEEPADAATAATGEAEETVAEGALKTGLYISTSIKDSTSATADKAGAVKYDATLVAVTVDANGVIQSCAIDSIPATVAFDAAGVITSDVAADVLTKNELGENYGMKAYGGAAYEWDEQVAALANYAVGKTVEELKKGAVNESGKAADADLATTATIYLGGYVAGIEAAVNNAQYLGAQAGDELRLATISSVSDSTSATAEKNGTAVLNADVVALTMNGGVITSCVIDSIQAKVSFDAAGAITTDLTAPVKTKNELGEAYGMKAYAGSTYEWNEQAASFAAYVTGKTAADVAGIAVTETTAPAEADLSATVTIAIGGFQNLIAKAAK